MSYAHIAILIVLLGAFFFYKKAKHRQAAIRAEAVKHYQALKHTVLLWHEDRTDDSLAEQAKQAASIHRERARNCALLGQVKFSPDHHEYLTTYKTLIDADKLATVAGSGTDSQASELATFDAALAELHALSQ